MSVRASCENCMYFEESQCHRRAPQMMHGKDVAYSAWPRVRPFDWCGDFFMAARHRRAGEILIDWPDGYQKDDAE